MALVVAGYGWESEAWSRDYYPEDLPPDWRFDYYVNEFRAVLLPQQRWRTADEALVARWCEDAHGQFSFHLELVVDGDEQMVRTLLDEVVLRCRWLGGYLGAVQVVLPVACPDWVYPLLREVSGQLPLSLSVPEGGRLEVARLPAAISLCRQAGAVPVCSGERPRVVTIEAMHDKRQLRRVVEALCATSGETETVLVSDDMVTLRDARTIAELLGC